MSANNYNLRVSRQYLTFLSIVYILSFLIIFMLNMTSIFKFTILLCFTVYMAIIMRRYCLLKTPTSIKSLKHIDGKQWLLGMQQEEVEATLLGDSTVTRWVSILRFQIEGQRRPQSCILFVDSLGSDLYRKLIVQVRST